MNMTRDMAPIKRVGGTDQLLDLIHVLKNPEIYEQRLAALEQAREDANFAVGQLTDAQRLPEIKKEAETLREKARIELENAREKAETMVNTAKIDNQKRELALRTKEGDLDKLESDLNEREAKLDKREDYIEEEEKRIANMQRHLNEREESLSKRETEYQKRASKLAEALGG